MNKITSALLLATVLLASCNQYEKSPSGMTYKVKSGGSKEKIKHGQFVKMYMEYKLKSKDTTLQSNYEHVPFYFPVDTAKLGQHTFTEIITKLGAGDKVDFTLFIDTLKKLQIMDYNDMFKQGDQVNGRAEILKVFNTQDEVKADYAKEMDLEKQRSIAKVKEYVKSKNLTAQSTPGGVQVVIDKEGTGATADSGMQLIVKYKGYLINKGGKDDGKVFDTNMDPKGPNVQPLSVILGTGGVIPGWEEALKLFKKGTKARIYIPTTLAWGDQGSPPVIPAYANVGFDVEVLDIVVPQPQKAGTPAPAAENHDGHGH